MKEIVKTTINRNEELLTDLALYIGSHPELGNEEVLAYTRLTHELEKQGFRVERSVLNIPTAFIAEYASAKPGPTIAFLCEYDALPELGHACGHHLIAAMSVGAAIGLKSVVDETGGRIRVYGTPAEETKGAKVPMAAAGMFKDVDAALMTHPYHAHIQSGTSLAMDAIEFSYYGKAAHAAASPHEGINALDAVIMLFNSINALRQQLPSHTRIHGIIVDGGSAANIIPERAVAQFYIRSANRPITDETVRKVLRCAEGAALQTGCRLETSNYEYSYDELITNAALSKVYTTNLLELGINPEVIKEGKDNGSLDLGNVSRQCPTIHPYVQVTEQPYLLHTPEFYAAAMQPRAIEGMLLGAKLLALTAYDVLTQPELLTQIKTEWNEAVQQ